jgi:CubicO group peptidase (beta-lactamase class C family)
MPAIRAALVLAALASACGAAELAWPADEWPAAAPADAGLDAALLQQARDYALRGGGSGLIVRGGRAVLAWGDQHQTYDLKSSTKALGLTALGLALADGKVKSLHDKAAQYHPTFAVPPEENRDSPWRGRITLFHLATQTAGFDKPGGYTAIQFEPGTRWQYSDGGPNWLAECLTLAYRRDLADLLFERVFTPIGIEPSDLKWRANSYRPKEIEGLARREFGAGISASVDAMARIGLLYLRRGKWRDRQLLPADFIDAARATPPEVRGLPVTKPADYGRASDHYGLLWWNNADGTLAAVPTDAYWSWGLYDSLTVVVPSLDLVVARAGKSLPRSGGEHYDVLKPFLEPIARAALLPAPYPPSPVIRRVTWDPPDRIIRLAPGSDNWPLTHLADGSLLAAYGDGRGFEPFVPKKLSLGLARITGDPPAVRGENVRAPTAEKTGDGARGLKASGLLGIRGIVYMLARNAGNSQLAWSADAGATWTWAEWKFTQGFGAPTFIQFGPDYAGSRDGYAYAVSHDSDSAYAPADRMVMARAPVERVREQDAWEFFVRLDDGGRPVWSNSAADRGAVFRNPGRCYRSGISYNAPLRRYMWCQTLPGEDPRFAGGLAVFDAPEPWGPWTTVLVADPWDVGPGETSSLPPRWMSADGRTVHLVFSGEDCFSVRRATLEVTP